MQGLFMRPDVLVGYVCSESGEVIRFELHMICIVK
jgi:hypothetical protein